MKKVIKLAEIIAFVLVIGLAFTACGSGGGKSINSAEALKEYLDKQSANSPDKPIKISMNVNNLMLKSIGEVIGSTGKYVTLDLSKSAGLTTIGEVAFLDCISLTNIIIPNGVTSIGKGAFVRCTSLASITIPNSVTVIEQAAFGLCTSLASITIPNSVTVIEQGAFAGCTSLASITIPNSVTSIGESAFQECTKLASVIIPNSVTRIGQSAFSKCESLTSIIIPNSVTVIERGAFTGCTSLASVTFQGMIDKNNFISTYFYGYWFDSFDGDLRAKYLDVSGGIGTYTTTPKRSESIWTKQ